MAMVEVGCGFADITPRVGTPLSGFAFRENKPSTSIDTRLLARALALGSEHDLYLLISYDLLGISRQLEERILADLEASLGQMFSRQRCALFATHTHSGPPIMGLAGEAKSDPAYLQLVSARTAEAARLAVDRMEAAVLHHATIHVPNLTYNRRSILSDGRVSMALEPDVHVVKRGPVDDRMTALVWRTRRGRNLAAAIHFACHGVGTCTMAIGYDIPGELANAVGRLLGSPCLYLQGAAGDINPRLVVGDRRQLLAWVSHAMDCIEDLPSKLARADSNGLQVASTELPLRHAPFPPCEEIERNVVALEMVAGGDLASVEAQRALGLLSDILNIKPGDRLDPDKAAYAAALFAGTWRRTLAAASVGSHLDPSFLRLSTWHIGDTILAAAAGELFAATGLRIQAQHRDLRVLPVSYLAPLVGYIPDREAIGLGGYEVNDAWQFYGHLAPFDSGSEELVVEAISSLIDQLPTS